MLFRDGLQETFECLSVVFPNFEQSHFYVKKIALLRLGIAYSNQFVNVLWSYLNITQSPHNKFFLCHGKTLSLFFIISNILWNILNLVFKCLHNNIVVD